MEDVGETMDQVIEPSPTVAELIEQQAFSRTQILVVMLVSSVLVLDGLNLQLLAYSLPAIVKQWGISKTAVSLAVGMTMAGMTAGALVGGALGDQWGRRRALLATIGLFAFMTVGCSLSQNVVHLTAFRLLSGLGFGACFPNAAALVAEWVPRRRIGLAVGIISVGVPLGGMAGALLTVMIQPLFGWRGCFVAGGLLPALLLFVSLLVLPESPAWLARQDTLGKAGLQRLARRAWGWDGEIATAPAPSPGNRGTGMFARESLLSSTNLRLNLGLWLAFFSNTLVANAILAWGTTALAQLNVPLQDAVRAAVPYNIASMGMTIAASLLSARLGSRKLLIGLAVGGAAGCVAAAFYSGAVAAGDISPLRVVAGYIVVGGAMGGIQALVFAVAAHAYPTAYRSAGVGVSSAIGRIGGIVSGFGGGAILSMASTTSFFGLSGLLLLLVAISALVINRHIEAGPK